MHGWYKLKDNILQSNSTPNKSTRSIANNQIDAHNFNGDTSTKQSRISEQFLSRTNINGHALDSSDSDQIACLSDRSLNRSHSSSIISLASPIILLNDDLLSSDIESISNSIVSSPISLGIHEQTRDEVDILSLVVVNIRLGDMMLIENLSCCTIGNM
jgi:hypothetical protein